MMDVIVAGKQVFDLEIEALEKTRDILDDTFVKIVEKITTCKGKLIITGMGKPGHIATKLAATFSSLGTPAFFLHPGEAMHGDLGMVSEDDIVLAISLSGESDELIRILPVIKIIGATLIAITANEHSSLALAADIVQILPPMREACHLNLAPTSSTTAELCYGDALAVVASQIYDFTNSDFGMFHPAGALGKKLIIKVDDLMVKDELVPKVYTGTLLMDAITELSEKRMGMVSIVDHEGYLGGIITDADLRAVIRQHGDIYSILVDDVMNPNPKVFGQMRLAVDALQYMKQQTINVLPILDDDNKLVGTLHWQQIIKAGIVI